MTLGKLIASKKCRVGRIAGTSNEGRYWLVCDPIDLLDLGNGWDRREEKCTLRLCHYSDGNVSAFVRMKWEDNRNGLRGKRDYHVPRLLDCECAEEVEVELKRGIVLGWNPDEDRDMKQECYQEYFRTGLFAALGGLGLPGSKPGPDE